MRNIESSIAIENNENIANFREQITIILSKDPSLHHLRNVANMWHIINSMAENNQIDTEFVEKLKHTQREKILKILSSIFEININD